MSADIEVPFQAATCIAQVATIRVSLTYILNICAISLLSSRKAEIRTFWPGPDVGNIDFKSMLASIISSTTNYIIIPAIRMYNLIMINFCVSKLSLAYAFAQL